MSKEKPKSLSELVGAGDSSLGQLAAAARLRVGLSEHVRKGLGEPLGAAIMHCNLHDDGTLVVVAVSAEWASRLRFESQQLLSLCAEFGTPAAAVKVRVSS